MKTHIKIGIIFCLLLIGNHIFAQKQTEIEDSDIKGYFRPASDLKLNKITIPTDLKYKRNIMSQEIEKTIFSYLTQTIEQGKKQAVERNKIAALHLIEEFVEIQNLLKDPYFLYLLGLKDDYLKKAERLSKFYFEQKS